MSGAILPAQRRPEHSERFGVSVVGGKGSNQLFAVSLGPALLHGAVLDRPGGTEPPPHPLFAELQTTL